MPVSPHTLARLAVTLMIVAAVGTGVSWGQIYLGGEWRGFASAGVAACILILLTSLPAIGYWVSTGLKVVPPK